MSAPAPPPLPGLGRDTCWAIYQGPCDASVIIDEMLKKLDREKFFNPSSLIIQGEGVMLQDARAAID